MRLGRHLLLGVFFAALLGAWSVSICAADTPPLSRSPYAAPNPPASAADANRYGLFGLLDRRSIYGTFWFPEPLQADEADVDNEVSLNFFHSEKKRDQFDAVHVEVEHAFGLLTLEIAGGYESDRSLTFNAGTNRFDRDTEAGFSNIELGARYPFYQYVSADGLFDDTFVLSLELSPPTHTKVSKDTEIVPKINNLLKLGNHFSLQTGVGLSTLIGPEDHGLATLEYSAVFGYELTHDMLPIPGVLRTVPLLEFDGEYTFNHEDAGRNSLLAIVGLHFDFESISFPPSQPRLGIGFAFPIDQGARDDFRWGIVTSIIFEY